MRILLTTRGSSGHILPLAPFGHACLRAGHEVMIAAQRQHQSNIDRTGLAFAPVDDPPKREWMPLMAQFERLSVEAANARMVSEFFAGIDTRAALPRLRAIVEDWQPNVIVRESWEFASTLVARAVRRAARARRPGPGGRRGAVDPPDRRGCRSGARRDRPSARSGRQPAPRRSVPHDGP